MTKYCVHGEILHVNVSRKQHRFAVPFQSETHTHTHTHTVIQTPPFP